MESSTKSVQRSSVKESGSLRPTTPLLTTRYQRTSRATRGYATLRAGHSSFAGETEPKYLPRGWSAHVHPEGQLYFACATNPRVVTEADLYDCQVQEAICYWIEQFNACLATRSIALPDTAELFLQLGEEPNACLYYLADYASRVIFWIEDDLSTEELGFSETVSDVHLHILLEEHFWSHVEFFSAHRSSELSLSDLLVDELATVFLHGRTDQLTSVTSTFPYNAEQCTQFMDVLNAAKSEIFLLRYIADTTLTARLWVVITHYRFNNLYGDKHARLSSDQSVLDLPSIPRSRLFSAVSMLLFNVPSSYERQFEDLWVDELVYQEPWQKAMKVFRDEWIVCTALVCQLPINVWMLMLPETTRSVMLASMLMCNMSVLFSAILLMKHRRATTYVADEAAAYLSEARREASGFRWTALAFSLPKALLLWALGISSAQSLVWLCEATSVHVLGGAVLAIFALCLYSGAVPVSRTLPEGCSFLTFWRMFRIRANRQSEECVV
ncbi:uncharacterized protein LAESUDRAFT_785263 [Laetiporus sulphureus 93-53]|uniref:WW domain-containing protein n=1 Tax=Laetiporus sulphureus 93-53 TaxID=1314785 RepID=A0A165DB66_9APHY|nr:uncharacterized protein LAESUDRAFT_785263 [Laetiporus sulphureus 93-53]KZT04470.1 hypothetical protein LAESUDRAFT_785263 [Laetiporus sulphureus 93-53]